MIPSLNINRLQDDDRVYLPCALSLARLSQNGHGAQRNYTTAAYGHTMKNPISAIIFILMWLGLGIGLIAIGKQGAREQRVHKDEVTSLSNRLVLAGSVLRGEVQRSTGFEKDLAQSKRAFSDLTNIFTQVSANLSQASNELAKTEAALKADAEEVKKGNARIAGLENQNQALDQRALDLAPPLPTSRFKSKTPKDNWPPPKATKPS